MTEIITLAHPANVPGATAEKGLLRMLTCGSVDDGKSTLIGRLLYDSRSVYEDQVQSIAKSTVNRAGAGLLDLSLLTDGLRAEREQGITIDVAYRYFSTAKRKFILADTPGHEQFTRNMATGASTADLAIILIDARHGVLPQSRRHAQICALLGIRQVTVAINKMDLAGYSESRYEEIRSEFATILDGLGFHNPYFLPVSALAGDNVVTKGTKMPWFDGPALLEYLETVEVESSAAEFRMPVQLVVRPDLHFRGYAGQIASGTVRKGDAVEVWPGGKHTTIARIVTYDGDLAEATAPQSVTLVLEHELDVARGSLIAAAGRAPIAARRFRADIVWMQERPLDGTHMWVIKHGTRLVRARLIRLVDRLDIATLTRGSASATNLGLNDIGLAEFEAVSPLHFDPYSTNRSMGAIVLIDPETNATAGAGMIRSAVESTFRPVTAAEREGRFGHNAAVVRLNGRHSLASRLERRIFDRGGVATVRDHASVDLLEALDAAGLIVILVEEAGPAWASDDGTACEQILKELFVDHGLESGEAI
ncbi:MAG TPA: GTP-binding protein [Bryobacteraceae bacterium]|jgi:sulfate adenylyltransferase large subunit